MLTEQRDEQAANKVLIKAIRRHGVVPETIPIAGSAANEAAIQSYHKEHDTSIAIRKITYLNHIVEHDHRAVKRVRRPMLGFPSFESAQSTLAGIELMPMLRKGQIESDEGVSLTAAEPFYALAL